MRTCARYHVEVRKAEERKKTEEELRMRNIASAIAREVDYFWSNIEQVKKKKRTQRYASSFIPQSSNDNDQPARPIYSQSVVLWSSCHRL